MEITPFHVGQEVIALVTHSQGAFKKGDEFIITAVFNECCQYKVTIGILKFNLRNTCQYCGKRSNNYTKEWIFNANLFAPKQKLMKVSFKEIMEEMPISAN